MLKYAMTEKKHNVKYTICKQKLDKKGIDIYKYPRFVTRFAHSVQGQLASFQLYILFLYIGRDVDVVISLGIILHIFGHMHLIVSLTHS